MEILGDNKISLTLTKDPENYNYTKHIDMIHHYIHESIDNEELRIVLIQSLTMLVNRLPKVFPAGSFKKHREK